MIDRIHWLGYGGFAIFDALRLYINPRRIARPALPADLILVSHNDYALCSPVDIDKLRAPHTQIIASESASADLPLGTVLRPWQTITVGRICIKAVPAQHGVGFVISMNYQDIYYAGDTGILPEMARIRADIALLPVGGALTAQAAAEVVAQIRPRYVLPYPSADAAPLDALALARLVGNTVQVILPNQAQA